MSGAAQQCPECGSPLRPCKCEDREDYLVEPGDVWNSTLGVRKGKRLTSSTPLRSRTLSEKYGDDPLRYGPLWDAVRRMPCFGKTFLIDHRCGPGYAPASAHHVDDKRHLDVLGLLPVCGRLHDRVEQFPGELRFIEHVTLDGLARVYVERGADILRKQDEMTEEIEAALAEAA